MNFEYTESAGDQSRTPVHFLHIGKTGGSAIKHALTGSYPWLHLHEHATRLSDIPVGQRVFFFLRDPVLRFVSAFYSRQRRGRPLLNSAWSKEEEVAFETFSSPNGLVRAMTAADTGLHAAALSAMTSIAHLRDSYWKWLGTPDELSERQDDILFIGWQENLDSDVRVLSQLLAIDMQLPRDPVQAHRNPVGLDCFLEESSKEFLKKWYFTEYQAIDACIEIAKRRGFGGSLAGMQPNHSPMADVPDGRHLGSDVGGPHLLRQRSARKGSSA